MTYNCDNDALQTHRLRLSFTEHLSLFQLANTADHCQYKFKCKWKRKITVPQSSDRRRSYVARFWW